MTTGMLSSRTSLSSRFLVPDSMTGISSSTQPIEYQMLESLKMPNPSAYLINLRNAQMARLKKVANYYALNDPNFIGWINLDSLTDSCNENCSKITNKKFSATRNHRSNNNSSDENNSHIYVIQSGSSASNNNSNINGISVCFCDKIRNNDNKYENKNDYNQNGITKHSKALGELNEVYMSRHTILQTCDSQQSGIEDVHNMYVKIQVQLLHQMLNSMQQKKIFDHFYSSPSSSRIEINRYMEKRRIQNSYRRLVENIKYVTGSSMDAFYDHICQHMVEEYYSMSYKEFDSALEAAKVWPQELTVYDKYEIFDLICFSNKSYKLNVLQNKLKNGKRNKYINKRSFLHSIKLLPFNLPDFPIPNDCDEVKECESVQEELLLMFPVICGILNIETMNSCCPRIIFKVIKCCYVSLLICRSVGIQFVFKNKNKELCSSENVVSPNYNYQSLSNIIDHEEDVEKLISGNKISYNSSNHNATYHMQPSIPRTSGNWHVMPSRLLSLQSSIPISLGISSKIVSMDSYQPSKFPPFSTTSDNALHAAPYPPAWGDRRITEVDKFGKQYTVGRWNFVPLWHLVQDFLMSRLVSLEELQVVLGELHSIESLKHSMELILVVATRFLLPFEMHCVSNPTSPFSQPLNIREITKRCLDTTIFDVHSHGQYRLNKIDSELKNTRGFMTGELKGTWSLHEAKVKIYSKLNVNWTSFMDKDNFKILPNCVNMDERNKNSAANVQEGGKNNFDHTRHGNYCSNNGHNKNSICYYCVRRECELIMSLINAKTTYQILEKFDLNEELGYFCLDIYTLQIVCDIFFSIFMNSPNFYHMKNILIAN